MMQLLYQLLVIPLSLKDSPYVINSNLFHVRMISADALMFVPELFYTINLVERGFLQYRVSKSKFRFGVGWNVERLLTGYKRSE